MKRGQASTEYLVILAVVMIIALVVVAILGGFIDIGSGASEQAAKAYWRTADIGMVDWSQSTTTFTAVVRNNQDYRIKITTMTVGTAASGSTPVILTPGATATLTATIPCTSGSSYSHQIAFIYDNEDYNVNDKTFTGSQNAVGSC